MNLEQELLYFKMQMLQAEIEMQGMIAENQLRISNGESPAYGKASFSYLVEDYDIYHNKFPFGGYTNGKL